MFIVVFENTLLLPRSGAEAEKGELYWSAARKGSSIFKTSRRCDHMMILWWLYNDHMIINDHMMIVSSEVTQPEIGAGFYPGSLALESTFLGRIWGWGSRLWVLRFCGGSETQVLRLKVFGSSHATQVQVHKLKNPKLFSVAIAFFVGGKNSRGIHHTNPVDCLK